MTRSARRVSFDDETLIVVDEDDNVLEYLSKADVHAGGGILHRAFSVFVFDEAGRLLLQQRSADKPLWPLYWSNSVCSHPRRGETQEGAARRRVAEELGLAVDPEHVLTFTYHAAYGDKGSEREVCAVYLARAGGEVRANEREVAAWRWVSRGELEAGMTAEPERYTPWLKMEWERLVRDHADSLARYGA